MSARRGQGAAPGGLVDLHVHYVPGVDDGVRTAEEGRELCAGLRDIGYVQLVATPHIRTGMFDNRKAGLERAFEGFCASLSDPASVPALGLGAEHYFDDVFWGLFRDGDALPYPGGHAALIEFPERDLPLRVETRFFQMRVAGTTPVLAHPERYRRLFRATDPIEPLLDAGLLLQLDLMALQGRYGRRPRAAAERLLEEEAYFIACSDAHRPQDVDTVASAIERLRELVDPDYARELMVDNPRALLAGDFDA